MDTKDRIKLLRETARLSQTDLARLLGLTPQSVQQWETGATTPRGKRLEKLADILGTTKEYILFGTEVNNSLYTKLSKLSPTLLAKVESYVDGLLAASGERGLTTPIIKKSYAADEAIADIETGYINEFGEIVSFEAESDDRRRGERRKHKG